MSDRERVIRSLLASWTAVFGLDDHDGPLDEDDDLDLDGA